MVRDADEPRRTHLSQVELSSWPFTIEPRRDTATTLDVLTHGDIEALGAIPWSSNAAIVAQLEHDGVAVTAMCKPRVGEQPLADFPDGTLCMREAAAYQLSALMGFDVVPETVLRETPWGISAVQRFIDHAPDEHFFTIRDDERWHPQLRQFALFDAVANNTDRKGGHVIIERGEATDFSRLRGIDHGLTFHIQWKLRTVIWEFQGEAFTDTEREALDRVVNADNLNMRFDGLLSSLEVDALAMRANALLERGTFPEPSGHHRDVPWPLV